VELLLPAERAQLTLTLNLHHAEIGSSHCWNGFSELLLPDTRRHERWGQPGSLRLRAENSSAAEAVKSPASAAELSCLRGPALRRSCLRGFCRFVLAIFFNRQLVR
jgi:hypothetical protein